MKVILILTIFTVFALMSGCSYAVQRERTVEAAVAPTPTQSNRAEQIVETETTDSEFQADDEPKFDIQLLETGEFHGDEVNARSGETWLGLFHSGNDAELIECKIKVSTVFDQIVDDEQKGEKTGRAVTIGGKKQPIFLLKNASFLKPSKVRTVFYYDINGAEPPDDTALRNRTTKKIVLNNVNYSLYVKTRAENETYLDESSTLILTDGNTEQTIYSQSRCDDCGWAIYWAGDLDGDAKLDLYLDLNHHYNVDHRRLFLSSQAENGMLVKEVANFVTVGC